MRRMPVLGTMFPGYEQFSRMFSSLKEMCDPANLGPFLDQNLVGSPETVAARIRQLQDIGFNYFVLDKRHLRSSAIGSSVDDPPLRERSDPAGGRRRAGAGASEVKSVL